MAGPLTGIRVLELAGIGPGPFCGRLLADLGARVTRIDRPPGAGSGLPGPLNHLDARGKASVVVDLKDPAGIEVVLQMAERADVLIDPFRPGVAERLGLGPDDCLQRNPRLVYGRVTGWGREGPLASAAGHDINYIGLVGALHAVGRAGDRPVPPLNLVGDYGGGALFLAFGITAALVERASSGRGQVIDAAMIDGAAGLMAPLFEMMALGAWRDERGANLVDGGAPFYDTYETADGRYMAVGAIEERFYRELLEGAGLAGVDLPDQLDRDGWQELRDRLAAVFRTRTRDEWERIFEGSDACVSPVLSMTDAPQHRHNVERKTFVEVDGVLGPAPAPRFDRTPSGPPAPGSAVGADTVRELSDAGFTPGEIERLLAGGVVAGVETR